MGMHPLIKNALQPFVVEHYRYKIDDPIGDVASNIHALLTSRNLLGSPNITGKLKGHRFEAYHKWTLIVIRGGGAPVTIYGTLESSAKNSTLIHLSIGSNPLFPALAIINLIVTSVLLYLYVVKAGLRLSGEEWAGAMVAAVAMVLWAIFAWITPYNLKRRLRQTFETNMGVKPLDTNGM